MGMFWVYRKVTEIGMLRAYHSVMDALPYSLSMSSPIGHFNRLCDANWSYIDVMGQDKMSHQKGVVKAPMKYVNLWGLSTTRCWWVIIP